MAIVPADGHIAEMWEFEYVRNGGASCTIYLKNRKGHHEISFASFGEPTPWHGSWTRGGNALLLNFNACWPERRSLHWTLLQAAPGADQLLEGHDYQGRPVVMLMKKYCITRGVGQPWVHVREVEHGPM